MPENIATRRELDRLSGDIAEFSAPKVTRFGQSTFFEATLGRATVNMGGLLGSALQQ